MLYSGHGVIGALVVGAETCVGGGALLSCVPFEAKKPYIGWPVPPQRVTRTGRPLIAPLSSRR